MNPGKRKPDGSRVGTCEVAIQINLSLMRGIEASSMLRIQLQFERIIVSTNSTSSMRLPCTVPINSFHDKLLTEAELPFVSRFWQLKEDRRWLLAGLKTLVNSNGSRTCKEARYHAGPNVLCSLHRNRSPCRYPRINQSFGIPTNRFQACVATLPVRNPWIFSFRVQYDSKFFLEKDVNIITVEAPNFENTET